MLLTSRSSFTTSNFLSFNENKEVGSEMVLLEEGDEDDGPRLLSAGGEAIHPDVEGKIEP